MLHIVSECLVPAMLPVGHDGAMNVANDAREYHLVTLAPNPAARFRHYIPAGQSLACTNFVRDNIMRPLGFAPERGEYPPLWVVGNGVGDHVWRAFSLRYDRRCPSGAIEITGYKAQSRDGTQIARELDFVLDNFCEARYASITILVDKNDLIEKLVENGFEISAYLPAWYQHAGARYDCVLMVRKSFVQEPADHGIRGVVQYFRRGLGNF
jgi:hypothetical protein